MLRGTSTQDPNFAIWRHEEFVFCVSPRPVPSPLVPYTNMATEVQHAPIPRMLMPLGTVTQAQPPFSDSFLLSSILTFSLSLADIEQQVGKKVWIIMRGEKEFTGTLSYYDEFISTKWRLFVSRISSSIANFWSSFA